MVTALLAALASAQPAEGPDYLTLEELAFWYRTDKSRDDHKYSDVYGTLLSPIRLQVRNLTEVGVFNGRLQDLWLFFVFVFGLVQRTGQAPTMHLTTWGLICFVKV